MEETILVRKLKDYIKEEMELSESTIRYLNKTINESSYHEEGCYRDIEAERGAQGILNNLLEFIKENKN